MHRDGVSTCKMLGLAAAAAVLALAGTNTALAQIDVPPDFVYQLSYFSNAHNTAAPSGQGVCDCTDWRRNLRGNVNWEELRCIET